MGFLDTFEGVVHRLYEMTPEGMAKKEEEARTAEQEHKAAKEQCRYDEAIRLASDRELLERAVRSLDNLNENIKNVNGKLESILNSIGDLQWEMR